MIISTFGVSLYNNFLSVCISFVESPIWNQASGDTNQPKKSYRIRNQQSITSMSLPTFVSTFLNYFVP